MEFNLEKSIEILERTPQTILTLLSGLSEDWIHKNEGPDTWSPYDITGHLIYGEKTDWIPRVKIILGHSEIKSFKPFNRFAQFTESKGKSISELLSEFKTLRFENIQTLKSLNIDQNKLKLKGIHPEFGEVTLQQLLSTWVVHDLGHIAQISRVMAKQYKAEAGPWKAYLGILTK